MPRLLGIDEFRQEARTQRKPEGGVFAVSIGEPKAVAGKERAYRFCFSDGSVDRMGDTIDPKGWDVTPFNRNPVALWAHDSSAPPIGRASSVMVENGRLMGDIEFAPAETYAFADTIYRLVAGKYLNAVSVGFLPLDFDWAKEDDRKWGIDFKRQELLEISICPVPANGNALIDARAKGIDTRPIVEWAERILDGGEKIIVPRSEIEQLRKAAQEPRRLLSGFKADGMSETDPAGGGALLGNCGRKASEECGMKNPAECSVHGVKAADDDQEKRMAAEVRRLVRDELKALLKSMRTKADDEPSEGGEPDEPREESLHKALGHAKASHVFHKMAMSHHKKSLDLLDDVVNNAEGDDDDDKDGDDDKKPPRDDDDGDEKALIAEIRRLRA